MTEQDIQRIEEGVLAKVREGRVRMKTRTHFTLRLVATVVLAVLALLLSSFVLSFIVFSLHESGEQLLLGFGLQGIETFLVLFPWMILALDLVVIVALEWLLQGFSIGYRFSLVSVFVAVFVVSAVLAALVNLTPLHSNLLHAADRGQLPILGEAYEHIHDTHEAEGVFRGTVVATGTSEIVIAHDDYDLDSDDATHTVALPSGYAEQFHLGEHVLVFGTPQGEVIQAEGVGQRPSFR